MLTSNNQIHREIGNSGIEASAVGLGTWAMGGWMWGGTDEDQSIKAIQAAIDEGISLIDTAPAYGLGKAEEIVGKAIKGRRDKVILATKCGLIWHSTQGNYFVDQEPEKIHRYLGSDGIRYEIEQSLRRLGTDYIDHYITHWQDPTTPIDETMETLLALKQEGKIRSIGVSNITQDDLNNYIAAGQVDAIQECYSMLDRGVETELRPLCLKNNISILSYSSLALGLLSGKIGPNREFSGDDQRKDNPRFSVSNRQKIADMFAETRPVAEAYGLNDAQMIIAWTIQQSGITFSLCGARTPEQAVENANAGRTVIAPDDIAVIDQIASKYIPSMDV